MDGQTVLDAFRVEAMALTGAVRHLPQAQWDLPTRCRPWRVRELVAHIRVVIGWVPGMLAQAEPARAEISAAQYYRGDERFSPHTNATRIALASEHAATHPTGPLLVDDLDLTWRDVARQCTDQTEDRVVRTRHGDAMLLSDFLITRVVEVAVHGLDVADAVGRPSWLTEAAADVVQALVLGPDWRTATARLGWDPAGLLRRATGRQPLDAEESDRVASLSIRWLALG